MDARATVERLPAKLMKLLVAVLAAAPPIALADPDVLHSVVIENDMLGRPSSDENYTMGVLYTASSHGKLLGPEVGYDALAWLNRVTGVTGKGAGARTLNFWSLGSTNFTPNDLTIAAPIANDRPYASLLYMGLGYQTEVSNDLLVETELRIGVLGTNVGKWVQTKIHERCCTSKIPQGWDNQIGDGGSPTFLYHVRFMKPVDLKRPESMRLQWTFGGEVGYYVRGFTGLAFTYGWTPKDLDSIRLAGSTTGMVSMAPMRPEMVVPEAWQAPPRRDGHSRGFGFWVEYEASLMAYNQLLQGAWSGENRVTFPASRMERLVHRASAGIDLAFIPKTLPWLEDKEFHLYYTQGFRSRDLKGTAHGSHAWGGLTLSFELP